MDRNPKPGGETAMDLTGLMPNPNESEEMTDNETREWSTRSKSHQRYDHFISRGGERWAGTHLLIDLYDAENLDDLDLMEKTLRGCVDAAGATLLHFHLHHFTPNDGISGVAVLAESHISVHTWPEAGYAAFDVFMCGDANPHACTDILSSAFNAGRVTISEQRRGSKV